MRLAACQPVPGGLGTGSFFGGDTCFVEASAENIEPVLTLLRQVPRRPPLRAAVKPCHSDPWERGLQARHVCRGVPPTQVKSALGSCKLGNPRTPQGVVPPLFRPQVDGAGILDGLCPLGSFL